MSFFGSFFGSDQRRDVERSNQQANKRLKQGFDQQQGYYDQSFDMLQPYAQQGTAANTFYNNALGIGGVDAQRFAYDQMNANPLFQNQLDNSNNAMMRILNARGTGGGGQANLAAQRVFQENMGNFLDRYRTAGQQGFQATNAGANIRMGQGDNAMGYGATRANMAVNYGNALADTRGIGINNLLNLAGTAVRAYTGMK